MRLTVKTCSANNAIRPGEPVSLTSDNPETNNPESITIKGNKTLKLHNPTFRFGEGYKNSKPSGYVIITGMADGPNREKIPTTVCLD